MDIAFKEASEIASLNRWHCLLAANAWVWNIHSADAALGQTRVTLIVNKNPLAHINCGAGKDVSDEDINDAKPPLQIKWYVSS
ncbi:MAG TPA: hypothetical protein VFV58_14240 [Blastocatellia bacterium]|jgi:hypothetical protein|nr:hypothetical protein [Blastocatellia bacterium]